ncbi:MAG: hypothetical protein SCALA702_14070 [Melioribacteraceae bacterium]|nr:MAG: hypothetical protein SCALA702_14070 [Melioribacteraceae bacterium]
MMKILLFLFLTASIIAQEVPFSRGVNLSGWLQTSSPYQIHFSKYTKEDFENIKSLGCDVIRLPIRLNDMTTGAPDYELDPLFVYFLDKIVEWAEEVDIHLILDNHTFDVDIPTSPDIGDVLVPVWRNVADRYKNSYSKIYYEILNEPHGIDDAIWGEIQGEVIDAIREVDTTHYIVVGPAGWNSFHNLQYMPEYEDDKLIYTFHFYDPFLFTHQGASWTDPSLEPIGGVPFPYNANNMPECPPSLLGTWVEGELQNYQNSGTTLNVVQLILKAVQFGNQRNVPLFCGEFGVYIPESNNVDRVYWYEKVKDYFENYNIAWTTWDYQGGFGLFEKGTNELFNYDLNVPLLEALDLNVPPQFEYVQTPDSTNILLYEDYFGSAISFNGYGPEGLNLYNSDSPKFGEFAISWTGGAQYSSLRMDFTRDKDLSYLLDNNFFFDMWVKGDSPGAKMDIRFLDTDTEYPADHPWRMGFTLDESYVSWDNEWQKVTVPLWEFEEKGAWENGWFEPAGLFDWSAIDLIEIVAEHHAFDGMTFMFDNIRIVDETTLSISDNEEKPETFSLEQNYPNPFNPVTTISFSIENGENYNLVLYNTLGEKVVVLRENIIGGGTIKHTLNAAKYNLSSGVYFYALEGEGMRIVRKMSYLK